MGNKVSLVGVDTAGGVITGPGKPNWTWNGRAMSVVGDGVAGHGAGAHAGPAIANGSPWFKIDGIPVTRATSKATCNDDASGSADMYIP
jgi:Uncharacterized conserved protein